MKCEVALIFEEDDSTLKKLFNIFIYTHHVSEPAIRKMLEPMLKDFLHERSYLQVMKLGVAGIPEEELVQIHLSNGLIRFNRPLIKIRGQQIKAMCYLIEQAAVLQAAAIGGNAPEYIQNLFLGQELILGQLKQVVMEALNHAGASGISIDKFSSQ